MVSFLCNLRCVVVPDMWVQRSDKHQAFVQEFRDAAFIRLNTNNAVLGEGEGCISDQANGLQYVENDDWFKDVQFKVTVGSSDGHRHVVAHGRIWRVHLLVHYVREALRCDDADADLRHRQCHA